MKILYLSFFGGGEGNRSNDVFNFPSTRFDLCDNNILRNKISENNSFDIKTKPGDFDKIENVDQIYVDIKSKGVFKKASLQE